MTKTEEALLPCPFCGAEAEMIGPLEEHENEGGYAVCCKCCQASSSVVFPDKVNPEDVLFPKWNTRTPEGQEMFAPTDKNGEFTHCILNKVAAEKAAENAQIMHPEFGPFKVVPVIVTKKES